MAGGLKHIKDHIKAIGNIQKVTNSMKMVSGSKFLRAEQNLVIAKPLGYAAMHFYDLNPIAVNVKLFKTHLFPITSDRGLCGSLPVRICKYTRSLISMGGEFRIVCLGEKTKLNFSFDMGELISLVINGPGHSVPTFIDASLIAQYVLRDQDFIYGKIIYAKFLSIVYYEVFELPIYSLPLLQGAKEIARYENEDEIINGYLEFTVAALFYYALCETFAAELASRMNAMSNATRNAAGLKKQLTLKFNRLRQGAITRDLIDIISGAQVVGLK